MKKLAGYTPSSVSICPHRFGTTMRFSRQETACRHCRELYGGSSTGEYDFEVATNKCSPEDLGLVVREIKSYEIKKYDDSFYLTGVWVLIGASIVVCLGIAVSKVIIDRGDKRIAEDMRRRSERRF